MVTFDVDIAAPPALPDWEGVLADAREAAGDHAAAAVLDRAGHAVDAGGLQGSHARPATARDLAVYFRQHKAERDAATIGDALLAGMGATRH